MVFSTFNWGSLKKITGGDVSLPSIIDAEAKSSDKAQEKTAPLHLPPADQSDDNVGITATRLHPMITAEGPALSEFAAAASMQQERSPSTLVTLPANFCQSRLSSSTIMRKMRQIT
eukprot:1300400-Ditylum_brightwellii.AAC.1